MALQKHYTTAEVAKSYGVKPGKVAEWCRTGDLRAIDAATRKGSKPRWRIPEDAIREFDVRRANKPVETSVRQQRPCKVNSKQAGWVDYFAAS